VIQIQKFRAKRLQVKTPGQRVDLFIRSAGGKLELTLTSPVTVTLTHPISTGKKRRRRLQASLVSA